MKKKEKLKQMRIAIIALALIIIILLIRLLYLKNANDEIAVEESEEIAEIVPHSGKSAVSTTNWDGEKVNIKYDSNNVPVPVPKGYTASSVTGENNIDTGFVIYEGEEEVNDDNAWTAQTTRNQYVWVPIYDPSALYGRDVNGAAHGKLYEISSVNGRTKLNWRTSKGSMVVSSSTGYREPLKDATSGTTIPRYLSEEGKEYNAEFEAMVESIEKYGGFYIGRYETGGLSVKGNEVVRKMNTDIANQTWTTMVTRCSDLGKNYDNVTTSMIYGCLFDATLEWLVESGAKNSAGTTLTYAYMSDNTYSKTWGNYSNSSFTYTTTSGGTATKSGSTRIPAGSSEYTKANNIYDLAGNVGEFTKEAYSSSYRVYRGGYYDSSFYASSRNVKGTTYSDYDFGCRAALWIN